MFVKALRLAGFKSFAEPTVLEFDQGVNVIVGPNGSGKSNIADALSWVLGSQAPTSLRGASMEDVIFAGSSVRPRLGVAEVELTLDNSSKVLPLDITEVSISRSTDRSGASEYRINGAPCRLLDILELMSDTGMGRSLHTVVGQGQLDQILQSRPEDRRAFIEEAAQVGKFRRRKDRSLRKLERVDDNLLRLNDVLLELTRAIRPLKRQAKAAAAFSELMAEHQGLRQKLAATELNRLARQEAVHDPEAEAHKARLLSDELANVRALSETAATDRTELAAAADRAQTVANSIGRAADRLGGIGRLARERAELIAARLSAETEESYRERIRLLGDERSRWSRELEVLTAGATRASQTLEAARGARDEAKSSLEAAERTVGEARAHETQAAQDLVRAEGTEAAGRASVGAFEARVQAALERREIAGQGLSQDARSIEVATREIEALEAELDRATQTSAAAETRLEEEREKADALRESLASRGSGHAAARARVETLTEVETLLGDIAEARSRLAPLIAQAKDAAELARVTEDDARTLVIRAEASVEGVWVEVARHDEELRRLDALMSGAAERLAAAQRTREAHEIELAALDEELARVRDSLATAEQAAGEVRAALPARRAELEQRTANRTALERESSEKRAGYENAQRTSSDAELESRAAEERVLAAQLRVEEADAGIADAQKALEGLAEVRAGLQQARLRALDVARVAADNASRGTTWAREAEQRAENVRESAVLADRKVITLRERERELEERLEQVSRKRSDAEVRRAELRARTQAMGERAMDDWGLTVPELLEFQSFGEDEEEEQARARADRLERQMRSLGPVNPHAADEFAELAERERFLIDQIEDLKSSKRDLMKIIREVDETIIEVFGTAYEDVAREFEGVFQRLFPGGIGRLTLTDPGDLLTTGIEVEAKPASKNVRKLSLLSGGERSLVALAFLFSIFRARPSPFYLLDEVEAALDDINLNRFLGLVAELEERAQVLIVTHQKRTMEAADVMYGVSMNTEGVSRVVAKRMEEVTL